jgi:multidrug efflux system membrane fusion protein
MASSVVTEKCVHNLVFPGDPRCRTAFLPRFTRKTTTEIEIMSTEAVPQSPLHASGSRDPDGPSQPPAARKSYWLRIAVYVVLIAGLGLIVWRIHKNQQLSAQNSVNQAAMLANQAIPVQVAAAEQKPMPIYLTALGTVTPYMSVTVKARVSGELEPVKFTEGQQVRQGQTIMTVDPRPYQAALNQAKGNLLHDEALLKNAQAEFARYKALFEGDAGRRRGCAGPVSGRNRRGQGRH